MSKGSIHLPRRYPGLKPFERSQSAVFHGRRDDAMALTNLILRERLVVLFAKSGIGKTSLLQAGCAPELEKQDFVAVFLRTEKTSAPIIDSISSLLEKSDYVSGQEEIGIIKDNPKTLWELMKRLEFDLSGMPATPVLVLDQFEEAFTLSHSESSRAQFLEQLADVANGTMPERLRKDLMARFQNGEIDVKTMQWWEKQPELRVVLSIRSDFLHLIDGMSARIPGILRNRYELLPLDRDKARTAIVKPAAQAEEYASHPFQYAPAALEEMLDFLSGHDAAATTEAKSQTKSEEIEAVNLQIICQDVEERIIDFQKHAGFEVDSQFYEGKTGLRNSIRNFYQNQLRQFPKAYVDRILQKTQQGAPISSLDKALTAKPVAELQDTAQRLIEESLITPGNRRNSVVDDTLISEYHVSPDFLDTLVDKSRLLRKEPRLDDFYYEISHDTLLPAVIESRNARRDKEQADRQKAEYQAQLVAEAKRREAIEAELAATRRQRKLARTVALTSFISLLVTLVCAVWFINEYVENARSQLNQAEFYVHNQLYNAADTTYRSLLSHPNRCWILENTPPHKQVGKEYQIVKQFDRAYRAIETNFVFADSLMLVNNYAPALRGYRMAEDSLQVYRKLNAEFSDDTLKDDWRVHRQLIDAKANLLQQRIVNAGQTLVREFKISQREYESFVEAKVWGQALRNLRRMKQLLPTHPSDEVDLKNALKINELPSEYVRKELLKCEARVKGL